MLSFSLRHFGALTRTVLGIAALVMLAGCGGKKSGLTNTTGRTGPGSPPVLADVLRKGDLIQIVFSGIPTPPANLEERIKEDGTINLALVGNLQAEGKSPGELQKEIQDAYVPKYFLRLTVTVKTERRVFYVDGEVRRPDRFVYEGEISLLQAIASAQGFTDFAAKGRVELVRNTGEQLTIDARKAKNNPLLDVPIVPGDRIYVPRRSPWGR
ncbi:MAG: polysaccharide biosynthesis/export family protein [Limisphaerales bacterium]